MQREFYFLDISNHWRYGAVHRMNRKDFIKTAALFSVVGYSRFGLSQTGNSPSDSGPVPDWVRKAVSDTGKRIDEWRKNRNCAMFIVITDLHSGIGGKGRNTVEHIRYANFAAESYGADAVVNLGDCGFEYPLKREDDGMLLLDTLLKYHSETKIPTLYCVGNHDHYRGRFSSEFLGWRFSPLCKDAVRSPGGDYGYLNLSKRKCRAFFLNSSDGAYYGFSDKQLEFLRSNLKKMPKDWSAVIFNHYCFDDLGNWETVPTPKYVNGKEFVKIMDDFVSEGGKLAGNIVGDSHFDRTFKRGGVNFFITQGYGGILKKDRPSDVDIIDFDCNSQMLAEAVLIDSKARQLKFFRIGAGGEKKDRSAAF